VSLVDLITTQGVAVPPNPRVLRFARAGSHHGRMFGSEDLQELKASVEDAHQYARLTAHRAPSAWIDRPVSDWVEFEARHEVLAMDANGDVPHWLVGSGIYWSRRTTRSGTTGGRTPRQLNLPSPSARLAVAQAFARSCVVEGKQREALVALCEAAASNPTMAGVVEVGEGGRRSLAHRLGTCATSLGKYLDAWTRTTCGPLPLVVSFHGKRVKRYQPLAAVQVPFLTEILLWMESFAVDAGDRNAARKLALAWAEGLEWTQQHESGRHGTESRAALRVCRPHQVLSDLRRDDGEGADAHDHCDHADDATSGGGGEHVAVAHGGDCG
jgi:hypothetical protein